MKLIIFIAAFLFSIFASAQESRIALVIGNANYEKGKLKNPVNDALLMQTTFQNLGFEVILDTNITSRDKFYTLIDTFLVRRSNYDVAFIYYAGHAVQINGENYMLATHEAYSSERDVRNLGMNINELIVDHQKPLSNKISVLILDACRDNPFEQSWTPQNRSLENGLGLAEMKNLPSGTIIAYSTKPGLTASDGKDNNSLYCKSLAKNLMLEGVRIEDVFSNIKTEVRSFDGKQTPTISVEWEGPPLYLRKTDLTNHIIEIDSLIDAGNINSFNAAREKISALLALYPNDKRSLLRKGRLELYNQNIEYDGSDFFKADKLFPNDSEVKLYLAQYYRAKGELESALADVNSSLSFNPENIESYEWKAIILLEYGDTVSALECFTKLIDLDKENPYRYESRAERYIEKKEFEKALIDLNKTIELAPKNAAFYNDRADFYNYNKNEPKKAIDDYETAFQLSDDNYNKARALHNKSLIIDEQGDLDLAILGYSRAIELTPDVWNSYSSRAKAYSKKGQSDFAILDFNKAIELDSENPERYNERANFFINQKQYENALRDFDRTIEINPKDANFYNNRADLFDDCLNKPERAIADYTTAFELATDYYEKSRALNNRALVYSKEGKIDLAIEGFSDAINEFQNPIYYDNRADLYFQNKLFDLALLDYTRAIELEKTTPERYYLKRADFYIHQKNTRNALSDFDKAIELAPNDGNLYRIRGDFYSSDQDNYKKAMRDYEKALELAESDIERAMTFNNIGLLLEIKTDFKGAIECYTQAINRTQENDFNGSLYLLNRAEAYAKIEESELALIDFNRAIDIDKNNPSLYEGRAGFYLERNEFEKSLIDISKSIELEPNNIDWIYFRADLYDQYLNQNLLAEQDYQQILKIDSTNILSIRLLGTILEEDEKYKNAMQLYNKGLKTLGADSIELSFCYFNRSLLNLKFNQIDSALSDIIHATELNAAESDFYYTKAHIHYFYQANCEESLINISKAIDLDSKNTESLILKARIFYEQNDYKKAIEIITLALELDKQNPDLFCKRGILWSKLKNFKNAELDFLNAQKNEASVQNTKLYLSKYYSLNQKTGNYIDLLYDLIQIDPMDPEPYYLLGEHYANIDDNTKASIYYATAITRLELSDYYISDILGNKIDNSLIYASIGDFCKSLNETDLMYVFYEKALDSARWNYELNICKLREDISKKLIESCGSECKIIQQEQTPPNNKAEGNSP